VLVATARCTRSRFRTAASAAAAAMALRSICG
jgi:hypothetical protein